MQGPLNEPAFEWAKANVPFFESSDKDLEQAYAFRWRAYFTHIIPTNLTTNPWVISECFSPTIPGRCSWAAPSGAINAAAGHHIRVKAEAICRCFLGHVERLLVITGGALDSRPGLHGF